jgi:lipoprotein-releasing system permease protein
VKNPSSIDFASLPEVPDGDSRQAEVWIALSHLRSKKGAFLSLVTMLSILGVVTGVAVLNIVLSVMSGFEIDLRDKILGANAHVVVLKYGASIPMSDNAVQKIEAVDGVRAAAPFVYTELMLRSSWGSSGVIVKGVDLVATPKVTSIADDLIEGPAGELTDPEGRKALFQALSAPFEAPKYRPNEGPLPGIFIGTELRDALQVAVGDRVQLINPLGGGSGIMGIPTPTVRNLRIGGVFYSGMYEYDTKWTYIRNDVAQDFMKMGDNFTGIEVAAVDVNDVEILAEKIHEALEYPYYAKHWKDLNRALFEALRLEKLVMGTILSMIVNVAGLLIVTTLIMLVITKRREIAILKAMGASSSAIMRIFIIEGTVIGVVGTTIGTILGYLGCFILERIEFPLETDVYYLSSLPVVVDPMNFVVIGAGALLVCFLATIYPAKKAAALDAVEGLRYE